MNIFVLDRSPERAAEYLCDQHVVKMIIETGQMFGSIMRSKGYHRNIELPNAPASVINHPCTKWIQESIQNAQWLCIHWQAMISEYRARYHKQHKYDSYPAVTLGFIVAKRILPNEPATEFVNCTPYKDIDNVVAAYRHYYRTDKQFARWRHSEQPEWY